MAELERGSSPVFGKRICRRKRANSSKNGVNYADTPREKRHKEKRGETVPIEMYRKMSGNAKRMPKYVPANIDGSWLAKISSKHAVSSWPKRTYAAKIKDRKNTQVEVGTVTNIPRVVLT